MAIESQPPVLRRVQQPNELEMISTLKAIQSNFTQNQLPKHFGSDKILEDVVYGLDAIKTIASDIFDFLSSSIKSTEARTRKLRSDIGGTHQKRLAIEPPKTVQQKQREEKEKEKDDEEKLEKRNKKERGFSPSIKMPKEMEGAVNGIVRGALGPLNLAIDPLMNLFGKENLTDLVKPNDADVKKKEGGIYWLWKKIFGKKDKSKDGGGIGGSFLQGLLGGAGAGGIAGIASKVFPILAKALPIAAIAGSIIWAAVNAIKAVGKAKEWGVSKVSAGIAGFFAGSGSGGIKDAFANAGKLAIKGAGIGMLAGGPVGALAGGLIGVVYGTVLGFIGGENVAKGIQSVGDGVKKIWTEGDIFDKILGIPSFLIQKMNEGLATAYSTIPTMIASIFVKDEKKLDKFKKSSKDFFSFMIELINPLSNLVNLIKNYFETILNIKNIFKDDSLSKSDKVKEVLKQVLLMPFQGLLKTNIVKKALNSDLVKKFTGLVKGTVSGVFETISNIKNIFKDDSLSKDDKVKEILKQVLLMPFKGLLKTNIVKKALNSDLSKKFTGMARGIFERTFSGAQNFVEAFKENPDYLKDVAESFVDSMRLAIHNTFFGIETAMNDFFRTNPIGKFLDQFIIQPIVGFFNTISDFFSFIGGLGLTGAIEMVVKGNFAESLQSHSEKQQSNRDVMRTKEWEEYDHAQKNKDFTKWKKLSDDEKIDQFKKDKTPEKVEEYVENDKKQRSFVNDAIITPQGRIIIPSSDDTIIATKSPVDKFRKDDISQDLKLFQNQPSEKNNDIVDAINKLIKIVDKKPFNNVFSTTSVESTNFDKLRTVFA